MNQNDAIQLVDVNKSFHDKPVLEHINLTVPEGSRVALMGPSGAGKSTLLKLIAHLIQPDTGTVITQADQQKISLVFDRDYLYEWMSCRENIELGLEQTRKNRKISKERAEKWGAFFNCSSFLDQKAGTLSAGQRQRTSLARAMMKEPEILLLDESFRSLDESLRRELMDKLIKLQKEQGFTIVAATHSSLEASQYYDTIYLVDHGTITPVSFNDLDE